MLKTQTDNNTPRYKKLPLNHVAIIMDGNRRYAKYNKISNYEGHRLGVSNLKNIVRHAGNLGLNYLTVYAFSSENWSRSADEVNYLFELFGKVLSDEFDELAKMNVRLSFIGDIAKLPENLYKSMLKCMEESKFNTGLKLQVAINYGSRMEIVNAVKAIVKDVLDKKLSPDKITETTIENYLYTKGLPDPELLIRTGGQLRLSNYLLYQSAYTEIYVTEKFWPEFSPADFDNAIDDFARRKRNYGGD